MNMQQLKWLFIIPPRSFTSKIELNVPGFYLTYDTYNLIFLQYWLNQSPRGIAVEDFIKTKTNGLKLNLQKGVKK